MPRGSPEELAEKSRRRKLADLAAQAQNQRREALECRLSGALARSGAAAYALWQEQRHELISVGLLAPDVIITPLAWLPQPPPRAFPPPLPPVPSVIEAAREAAELMAEKPVMTREDYVELGKHIARLKAYYQESGWLEE